MLKLGVIGCGNMAAAILKGIWKNDTGEALFYGCDSAPSKAAALAEIGMQPKAGLEEVLSASEYILLSVKPQNLDELLEEIAKSAHKDRVYLSIVAGATAKGIKKALGFDARIIPIMPNTQLLVGMGATAMAHVAPVSDEEFETAKRIFSCAGMVREVRPDQMSAIIPVNGSSPAFIYEFAKGFMEYAAGKEIDKEAALALFTQTLRGAADMLEHSGHDVDTLIQMVSSKGGTTVAGLDAFQANGFREAILAGCEACAKRAEELAI